MTNVITYEPSILTDDDLFLFNEGNHFRLYDKLGAQIIEKDGTIGTHFGVWAPAAGYVSVMGDFNDWNKYSHPLKSHGSSGIWQGFIPGVESGTVYKYHIESGYMGYKVDKADPFATFSEVPPKTGSVVWDLDYTWKDSEWMTTRSEKNSSHAPISIYEVHLGSWRRVTEENNRPLSYREIAPLLAEYINQTGFTHVEFLPLMEHPFYGSWGYQVTGFFAPTSRYGTPQDFMYLIDYLHQHNIGVILDWVPSHFPTDEFGLKFFDGTHLFEHSDDRQGMHRDWNTAIFNYGRHEVRSFLISNALFWLDKYHVDGLRVDAVASMLYLDYSREEGDWIPNEYGGRENIEAIHFLRKMNEEIYGNYPDVQTFAEESTSWPMVSRPTYLGGLGFGMKWDMGWMHDTLQYFQRDSVHRKYHHDQITFRMIYAFTENFVLSLSHDEVVHGKGSLLDKMPGDSWQKFANLRLLFGYMFAQPGKKLLFMGDEFGQGKEWNHDQSLDWHLLDIHCHEGVLHWLKDLNQYYKNSPAMHALDLSSEGFQWLDANDSEQSVLCFLRKGIQPSDFVLVACNFTPVPRHNYRIGVPLHGYWKESLNSDATYYWGSGQGNMGGVESEPIPYHNYSHSITITLPPLGIVCFEPT